MQITNHDRQLRHKYKTFVIKIHHYETNDEITANTLII